MLTTVYARKGGSGATTIAALTAITIARNGEHVVAVDLAGDLGAALATPTTCTDGSSAVVTALAHGVPNAAERASVNVADKLQLVTFDHELGDRLLALRAAQALADSRRRYVVDAGTLHGDSAATAFIEAADEAICVTRNCYLALRHLADLPRGRKVVLIEEPGRALGRSDIESLIGYEVAAVVPFDPALARAIDAGLLTGRVPDTAARHIETVITVRTA